MAKSRRGHAPAPGAAVPIRIENCPQEGSVHIRFLGSYVGTFMHYGGPKQPPRPCVGDGCPATIHSKRKQWRGYAPAEWYRRDPYNDWCACVFEVTESLNEILDGIELRGTIWEISRIIGDCGKREVNAVHVGVVESADLRPAWDVFPMVSRMLHFLPMQWGVPSHVPARIRMLPVKAPAPTNGIGSQHTTHRVSVERTAEEQAEIKRLIEEGRNQKRTPEAQTIPINGHKANGNGKAVHQ